VISGQWYVAEALGLLGQEAEVAAVLHGWTTRGSESGLMPALAGREGQLHERSIAAIRAELGEGRFEDLAGRGASMTYDSPADYTMAELHRIVASVSAGPDDEAH
jgi:hypothetical protein